ncbi:MAG: Enamine/imine deaminase [Firmicutes bacterium ADurb.Bin182]|nr:MAG: Enamine/imine deaminase [Firmicutes bacterium ADurb.Bin182]
MKKIVKAENAPAALGPYSHAVCAGQFIFTSGQLGMDPATGKLAQGVEEQARLALTNLEIILKSAGATLKDVVKTTIFVQDLKDFAAVNKIYGDIFGDMYPARSCVQVAALPAGGLVEIEAVAVKG